MGSKPVAIDNKFEGTLVPNTKLSHTHLTFVTYFFLIFFVTIEQPLTKFCHLALPHNKINEQHSNI